MIPINPLEGRKCQHFAIVEYTPPEMAGGLTEPLKMDIFQQQHLAATRANIQ
jgi:hypothetical protein